MLLLFPILDVNVGDLYSHVYGLHGNVIFGLSVWYSCLELTFGKVMQIHYIVHFGNNLEIYVSKSIAVEPLLVETRVRYITEL